MFWMASCEKNESICGFSCLPKISSRLLFFVLGISSLIDIGSNHSIYTFLPPHDILSSPLHSIRSFIPPTSFQPNHSPQPFPPSPNPHIPFQWLSGSMPTIPYYRPASEGSEWWMVITEAKVPNGSNVILLFTGNSLIERGVYSIKRLN